MTDKVVCSNCGHPFHGLTECPPLVVEGLAAFATDPARARALLAKTRAELSALEKPDPSEAGGNACPKCGEHSFRLQATFAGSVDITFSDDPEDPTDFDVDDSEPTDSEWDGPVECLNCNWSGVLADLVTVTAATAAVVVPSA